MSKRKNNRLGKAGITFYTYATERIREKRLAGKHNTADLYRTTRNWICAFLGRRTFFSGDNPGLNKPFCRLPAIRRLASEYREYIPQQLSLDL